MKTVLTKKLKYIVLVFAVALCVFGIYSGEMEVILKKAVLVCLECCGIG